MKDLFADIPIILKLMEYNASCVSIPERIAGIPSFVCRSPVTAPAARPARTAISRHDHIGNPAILSITVTAPPVVNEPSTVKSAMSSILNVM